MVWGPRQPAGDNAEKADGVDTTNKDRGSGRHQVFYLALGGLGGMVISGGVNFSLACAVYATQDTAKTPIRLFRLPLSLAGDAAVTIVAQCLITWCVEAARVTHDVCRGAVQPIGRARGEPANRLLRALFFLPRDRGATPATRVRVLAPRPLAQHLLRGLLVAAIVFVPFWSTAVGLLMGVGDWDGGNWRDWHRRGRRWNSMDWHYRNRWAPQVFKLLLGGVLGLLTTPLFDLFWLVRAGWVAGRDASSSDA